MTSKKLTTVREARAFIEAGRAKVSLKSLKTGNHYTYKIRKGSGPFWYVSTQMALYKGDKVEYTYLGYIGTRGFSSSPKTLHQAKSSTQFKVWDWFWNELTINHRIHSLLEIYHEGECGMCGKKLTDPESINSGYGPECRKKVLAEQGLQGKLWE